VEAQIVCAMQRRMNFGRDLESRAWKMKWRRIASKMLKREQKQQVPYMKMKFESWSMNWRILCNLNGSGFIQNISRPVKVNELVFMFKIIVRYT
jgi:hypothetical protein